ncbi:MAG: hypothetical protein QW279_12740, partial [Candidatus Jordarchaeaceae archaeon]
MGNFTELINKYGDDKDFDGCSIFGMMNLQGQRFSSKDPIRAISSMHERSNGLGGGFALYGLYPEYPDDYAFHIMYLNNKAKEKTEKLLNKYFDVITYEEIPTKKANVFNPPKMWRYFVQPNVKKMSTKTADDYVLEKVMHINTEIGKAFVISSGKNMGVFKGVGYPEDISEFFCLEEYEAYMWICHGRFPTNTPGWWGGSHPQSILDWSVVHNGELSSYDTNRRFLEMYGYKCTMQTDTEVLAYAFDLLIRKQKLPINIVSSIIAAPFWDDIDRMEPSQSQIFRTLRQTYGRLLMNGPFSIIVARHGEIIGLTDRIKLRPLNVGIRENFFYISSEESAIRLISPTLDKSWNPRGGE